MTTEPTDSTYRSYPGSVSWPLAEPALPPAATTTIPARQAFSNAKLSGSTSESWVLAVPYDRLITRIGLAGSSLRCATTQSTAAITWVTSTTPVAVPTLIEVNLTFGATPRKP